MDTVKFNKRNTLMVAHRGLSGLERENTAAAFIAAANRTYYGIETDIYRTLDGKFVICHDSALLRLVGEDVSVESLTLDTIQSLVLYDTYGTKTRADLRLPTLENYIDICKRYGKHCVLELKSAFTDEETERFINVIKELDYLEGVTFISFNYENLKRVKKILPEQSCQYLFSDVTDETIEMLVNDKIDLDIHYSKLTQELVNKLHAAGIIINCWTVDNPDSAERVAAMGVDYITSNILE